MQEVVAGTNESSVVIFDIETERPKCSACFHDDDVNAVAFVDAACNVVVSGSDDTTLLISDRCVYICFENLFLRVTLFLRVILIRGACCVQVRLLTVEACASGGVMTHETL